MHGASVTVQGRGFGGADTYVAPVSGRSQDCLGRIDPAGGRSTMRLLVFLVYAFVNTFGITQPTPTGARRAARYVGGVLVIGLLLAMAAALELRGALHP